MNWLEQLAWTEAYTLIHRIQTIPNFHKKIGFSTANEAIVWEVKRVVRMFNNV